MKKDKLIFALFVDKDHLKKAKKLVHKSKKLEYVTTVYLEPDMFSIISDCYAIYVLAEKKKDFNKFAAKYTDELDVRTIF